MLVNFGALGIFPGGMVMTKLSCSTGNSKPLSSSTLSCNFRSLSTVTTPTDLGSVKLKFRGISPVMPLTTRLISTMVAEDVLLVETEAPFRVMPVALAGRGKLMAVVTYSMRRVTVIFT